MGGDTFPELHTIRYSKEQYLILKDFIISKFSSLFDRINDTIILPTKTSFGDIDILYQSSKPIDWEFIQKELKSSVKLDNGPFHSFTYDSEVQSPAIDLSISSGGNAFQVDFIEVKYWDWENFLMSYGGIFNLLGPKFKQHSMKLTNNGIYYILRDEKGDQYSTIKLTDDFPKIMEFIGLDIEKFQLGFKNEEELALYIAESPFFQLIDYEHSNCKIKRNLVRPIQKSCIDYIRNLVEKKLISLKDFTMTKEEIFIYFGVYDDYLIELKEVEKRKTIKSKFNATIVSEITGKTGRELGQITNKLKLTDGFLEFVLVSSKEEIREKIQGLIMSI